MMGLTQIAVRSGEIPVLHGANCYKWYIYIFHGMHSIHDNGYHVLIGLVYILNINIPSYK